MIKAKKKKLNINKTRGERADGRLANHSLCLETTQKISIKKRHRLNQQKKQNQQQQQYATNMRERKTQ